MTKIRAKKLYEVTSKYLTTKELNKFVNHSLPYKASKWQVQMRFSTLEKIMKALKYKQKKSLKISQELAKIHISDFIELEK